jgi:hypothetical protein
VPDGPSGGSGFIHKIQRVVESQPAAPRPGLPDPPKFEQQMMRRINDLDCGFDLRPQMVRNSPGPHCSGANFCRFFPFAFPDGVESSISGHSGYGIVLADAFPALLHCIVRR